MIAKLHIDRCDCKVAAVGNYNIDMVVGRIDELPAWGLRPQFRMQVRAAGSAGYTAIAWPLWALA